ncbi:MCE family protein [Mycobacterium sp. AZCC_0083]|uniref:MCE family protein n=1 Tax=Mycobacterium sp. AZCC_0083 TaxID=2735882 RepID=UPI00161AB2AA|nr:MCE family protein [Mycobacterium sp. AZCC_0083]MBB5167857.1 phospholipid/cholesterol/gamma-HCH transport system substrate-binding protein [Mycobacterium sp. AZCC_0083]
MTPRRVKALVAAFLAVVLVGGIAVVATVRHIGKTTLVAYFDNSNGVFRGDDVFMLGVPVGKIVEIEPEPSRAKITFWVDDQYKIPADVKAVILLPQLITARAIALTPVYSGGPALSSGAVIPQDRTAVPVEWDDLRDQLQKLADALQPTTPGGVSPLGELINTAANNLRGNGGSIRDAIIKLSQTLSALGDHSNDLFSTLRNLSTLVSALHDSADVMRALNTNLAAVTGLLANDPDEVGQVVDDLNTASGKVKDFVAENREALGTTSDKLATISTAVHDSLDDIKQTLHVAPTAFQNFLNIYEPAHAAFTGALALNNFANPITFLCGAIQAASRMNAEDSAKLCVQYLAPIIKNRQYNFLPIGENLIVGAQARPNEITYSEDWMRPDYNPAAAVSPVGPPPPAEAPAPIAPLAAEAPPPESAEPVATNPAAGLPGLMVPNGAGS